MGGPWWQTAVIHQVYPRSFQDSDGDGIGDLPGITARLDYLSWLGVDALWLSPIFKSPMADFGYDVADYCDVDPIFGSLTDLDALISAAHGHGIKILLDYVPNHTSSEHPWFIASRSSRSNPKRDWYIWRDAATDGQPPNRFRSAFGGSTWQWDEQTSQFYFHSSLKEQPDLNWENPAVRDEMHRILRFWFERGVDGFRIDVVNLLAKDQELRPSATRARRQTWGDEARVQERIAELRRVADEFDDRLLIGEIWLPVRKLVAYYGLGLTGLHLPFNFQLLILPWSAARIGRAIATYERLLPQGAWPNWVLGNHDKPRIASRVGAEQARVAAMLLLTLRGTPTIYYGDEIGMNDVHIPRELQRDPQGLRGGETRDPQRTPMRWNANASTNAGFTTGTPWLPMGTDAETINVAAQRDDPRSMLTLHRRLMELRRREPVLSVGAWSPITAETDVLAFERSVPGRRILVALNLPPSALRIAIDGNGGGRILMSTGVDRMGETVGNRCELRPNEGVVAELDA